MNTHADQTQENKSQSVANEISQKQSGGESTFQFVDNRPEAVAQRKLQAMANNSPRAMQFKAIQEMANNSPQGNQAAQLQAMATPNGIGVIQRYPTIDDDGREDAVIYVIYENNGKKDGSNILYVGQTTSNREFTRFQEHVKNDSWAPWYIHATPAGLDYSVSRDKWPYDYKVVEILKDVTKFETTVAEQWWMEFYMKKGLTLLNDSTPCTLDNFNKRSVNSSLYDPKNIGIDWSYKPSLKAK
jgi:hypothetical protein